MAIVTQLLTAWVRNVLVHLLFGAARTFYLFIYDTLQLFLLIHFLTVAKVITFELSLQTFSSNNSNSAFFI